MPNLFFFFPLPLTSGPGYSCSRVGAETTHPLRSGCSAGCRRGSRHGHGQAEQQTPVRGPARVNRAATGRGLASVSTRTHAHCAQHEGCGPDQVMRSGATSLFLGKTKSDLGRSKRLGNGFLGSRVGGSAPGPPEEAGRRAAPVALALACAPHPCQS